MNGLDLCTGIGGITEGLRDWVNPIAYCENDESAQAMLLSRQYRGELPTAPIWDDIRSLRGGMFPEQSIDIIYGGFPCTDISLAGNRAGMAGERSGLIWEIVRLSREISPCFVFIENVWPGIRKFIPSIRNAFEELGFQVRDGVLAARDVGARHKRERWFMLASNPMRIARRIQPGRRIWKNWKKEIFFGDALENGIHPDADGERVEECGAQIRFGSQQPFGVDLLEGNNWDEYAAFFLRMDSGIPNRGNRIRALGNACPPIQYREAFKRLMGIAK